MANKIKLSITLLVVQLLFLAGNVFSSPGAITSLVVNAGYKRVTLNWSAPFDTGESLAPVKYEVRISTYRVLIDTNDWDNNSSDIGYPYRMKWSTATTAGFLETAVITGLTNGKTYFFSIRSSTSGVSDYYDWSAMDATSPEPQAQPQNIVPNGSGNYLPANGALVSVATPTFSWNPASPGYPDSIQGDAIASYTVYINTASDFSGVSWASLIKSAISTNSYVVPVPSALNDNTTYYWKVFAYDTDGAQCQLFSPYQRIIVNAVNSPPSPVLLGTPANGETVNGLPQTFTWSVSVDSDPGDTLDYVIHISSMPNFAVQMTSDAHNTTAIDIDGTFVENATYYWYVVVHDTNSAGLPLSYIQSASTKSFCINLVQNQSPFPFSLIYPDSGSVIYSSTPTLTWQDTTDPDPGDFIDYYEVHWSSWSSALTVGVDFYTQNVPTTSLVCSDLVEDATYWWLVIGHSYAGQMVYTDTRCFVADGIDVLPSTPSITAPASAIVSTNLRPLLDWSDSVDPDPFATVTYSVIYSSNNFAASITTAGIVASNFTPSANLQDNSAYSWRVQAINNRGGTTNSATSYFYTNVTTEAPAGFNLTSPSTGSVQNFLKMVFDWADAVAPDQQDHITAYELRYSTDSLFRVYTSSAGIAYSSYTNTSALINNSTYYWRVKATGLSGSTWSNTTGYFIANSTFALISPSSGSAQNFMKTTFVWGDMPDPDSSDDIFVTYEIQYSTNVAFTVYTSSAGLRITTYTIQSALINSVTYYWKVRATALTGDTWSMTVGSFYTNTSFALTAPANGSLQNYLKVSYDWTDMPDPDPADSISVTYEIWYSTDSLFRIYTSSSGLVDSTYTITSAILNNTTYYWKVRASTSVAASYYTWSSGSNGWFFTGTGFSLVSPANKTTSSSLRPLFDWTDVADPDLTDNISVSYELQLSRYADFSLMYSSISNLTISSFTLTSQLMNYTTFFWRVKAQTSAGSSYSSQSNTLYVLNYYPVAFDLSAPANNSILVSTNIAFAWLPTYDTESEPILYAIHFASNPNFSDQIVISSQATPSLTVDISSFSEDATYYWYVEARDSWNNKSQSTSSGTFRVNLVSQAPSSFILISPGYGALAMAGSFDWQNSNDLDPGDTTLYEINYSTSADFNTYYASSGLTTSDFTMPENLLGQSTYYWRVKAYGTSDPADINTWSITFIFYTPSPQPQAPEDFRLTAMSSDGSQCQFTWRVVSYNVDNSVYANPQGYRVYRARTYDLLNNTPVLVSSVSFSVNTATDTSLNNLDYYYFVKAVNQFDVESPPSNIIYANPSSLSNERVYFSADGGLNLNIPEALYQELNSNNDIGVAISRNTAEESASIYRVYDIGITKGGIAQTRFGSLLTVVFSYNDIAGAVSDVGELGISYYNGIEWMRITSEPDTNNKLIKVKTSHLTTFRMERISKITGFSLLNWPPAAKVITPNADNQNDELRLYYLNPQSQAASGRIFNLNGFFVADMQDKTEEKYFSWDGKDKLGNLMQSGIYIYQVSVKQQNSGDKIINGSIVVAR